MTKAECCRVRCPQRIGRDYARHACVPLRTADATAFCYSLVIRHSDFVIHTGAMLDIRLIREKPEFVRQRLATRGGGEDVRIDEVLRIDFERRKSETDLQRLQSERNRLSK